MFYLHSTVSKSLLLFNKEPSSPVSKVTGQLSPHAISAARSSGPHCVLVIHNAMFHSPQPSLPPLPGRDVIAQAQSGTGKTATFTISILQQIDMSKKQCQALVLAPTRELAQQIKKVCVCVGVWVWVCVCGCVCVCV